MVSCGSLWGILCEKRKTCTNQQPIVCPQVYTHPCFGPPSLRTCNLVSCSLTCALKDTFNLRNNTLICSGGRVSAIASWILRIRLQISRKHIDGTGAFTSHCKQKIRKIWVILHFWSILILANWTTNNQTWTYCCPLDIHVFMCFSYHIIFSGSSAFLGKVTGTVSSTHSPSHTPYMINTHLVNE